MLDSLYIKNYRNLKELTISSLGRVNLIIGKNNTGKSTLLEALAIYASNGDLDLIYELLKERGEYFTPLADTTKSLAEPNIKSLSSLFTNRAIQFNKDSSISIGKALPSRLREDKSDETSVSLRFVKYTDEIKKDAQGATIRKQTLLESDFDEQTIDFKIGLEIRSDGNSHILPLDEDNASLNKFRIRGLSYAEGMRAPRNIQFIRTRNIDKEINGKLWDKITLTDKEQFVIEALRIIEPSTERIAFIEEPSRRRTAVIKLANTPNVLPLQSMGDGINRILTIILALVHSDRGFLLIDEFENGLHYTVQEQLWTIIFKLAHQLDIQVFATTHSEDCITGFEHVLNSSVYSTDGKLIRLDNVNGQIKQVEFNAQELKIATDHHIETR